MRVAEKTPNGQKVPAECKEQKDHAEGEYLPDHESCKITNVPADWVSCISRTRKGQCSWFCKHTQKTIFSESNASFVPVEECTASPELAPKASGYEPGACKQSCADWNCGQNLPAWIHPKMLSLDVNVQYDIFKSEEN